MNLWSRDEGISLCVSLEEIAPAFGAHVALTGGLLYKEGLRKDCDILIYRIRQYDSIDWFGFFEAASTIGLAFISDHGWCKKCEFLGRPVDIFDAEDDGVYGPPESESFEAYSPPFDSYDDPRK